MNILRKTTGRLEAMRGRMQRARAIFACLPLLVMFWHVPAHASWCGLGGGVSTMTANLGSVTESSGNPVPVGNVIYTKDGSWDSFGGHTVGYCKSSSSANDRVSTTISMTMPGSPVAGFKDVYPTNLSGVGVRISVWTTNGYYRTPTTPTALPYEIIAPLQNDPINSGPAFGTGYLQVKVEVVKTASNWQAGALDFSGGQMLVSATDGNSGAPVTMTNVKVTGTMNTRSCAVTTPNVLVNFGSVKYPSDFAGALGPTKNFPIGLSCANGPQTSIEFDATPVAGNANVIALTGNSSARGIGVQLLDSSGNAVKLAQPIQLANPAPNGAQTYYFGARYYQTGTVSAGSANAIAQFVMTYQ